MHSLLHEIPASINLLTTKQLHNILQDIIHTPFHQSRSLILGFVQWFWSQKEPTKKRCALALSLCCQFFVAVRTTTTNAKKNSRLFRNRWFELTQNNQSSAFYPFWLCPFRRMRFFFGTTMELMDHYTLDFACLKNEHTLLELSHCKPGHVQNLLSLYKILSSYR